MRGIRCFLCVVVLVISALAAAGPIPQSATPAADAAKATGYPNIILVTLDTTRADRMGFLGSKRGLTPNLDMLARDSAVFTRAYSQAPLTPTSHSTIFTGTYPQYHQVLTFPIPLARALPFLPAILKEHGYATAAFVGSVALDPNLALPGFDRGFDTYDAGFELTNAGAGESRYHTIERRGGEVVARALDWLSKHPQGPFFLWVHLYDPHDPYDPPQPYKTRYAKTPYDGEIAYVDSAMGKFFQQLKATGRYDNTVVALTADHGESLGAHGEDAHGVFLYDETIHVPLLIKLMHGATAGKRIEDRVELADIMPTILGVLGIPVPEKVQGQSLLGFLQPDTTAGAVAAKAWQDRGAYSQADYGHLAWGWSSEQSLRTGKYLFVQAPRPELYEQTTDPKAEHDLASSSSAVAGTLSAKLKSFVQATTNTEKTPKTRMDESRAQKLAALGYMPSRDSSRVTTGEPEADPKDKIQIANTVIRVNDTMQAFPRETRCVKGIPILKSAIQKYPDFAPLHFDLGGCYLETEKYERAAAEFRQTLKLDPGFTRAQKTLGRALMRMQQFEEATTTFERASALDPDDLESHTFLIILYSRAGRQQDVIKQCQAILQRIPDNFGANMNLGQALLKTGDAQGAIVPLEKAIRGEPDKPGPHVILAEVYDQLGRPEDAKRERAEAQRLMGAPESSGPTQSSQTDNNKSPRD